MKNKLILTQLKQIILTLEENDLLRLFEFFSISVNLKIEKESKEISYKWYYKIIN